MFSNRFKRLTKGQVNYRTKVTTVVPVPMTDLNLYLDIKHKLTRNQFYLLHFERKLINLQSSRHLVPQRQLPSFLKPPITSGSRVLTSRLPFNKLNFLKLCWTLLFISGPILCFLTFKVEVSSTVPKLTTPDDNFFRTLVKEN